ncbi:MAG: hypothetical protein IPK67_06555 [Planctomycetes bacterium]|nr:hypothetical protein [Planctomycetota bacterium]
MQATIEQRAEQRAEQAAAMSNGQAGTPVQRGRTGKKRLSFGVPDKMPPGVKELWRASGSEAQERAHRSCVEILAMWLGKKPREEVARSLGVPPLRVWQLSQQALSGMLAGLLKQPRTRSTGAWPTEQRGEDSPRVLKMKVAALEEANKKLEKLVELLKELPRPGVRRRDRQSRIRRRKHELAEKRKHRKWLVMEYLKSGPLKHGELAELARWSGFSPRAIYSWRRGGGRGRPGRRPRTATQRVDARTRIASQLKELARGSAAGGAWQRCWRERARPCRRGWCKRRCAR